MPFWATAAVAMYGLVYYSCHDLKNFRSCHLLTLDSCHVAVQKHGKKHARIKRELSSAYKHTRAIAMYPAKTHDNSGKRELSSVYVHTRQLPCTLQNAWQLTCSGKKKSCHLLTSTLGQLPCTLQNICQLTCSGKRESCHLLTSTLGQLPCTPAKHMATGSFGCGRGDGRVGELINTNTPALVRECKLTCG